MVATAITSANNNRIRKGTRKVVRTSGGTLYAVVVDTTDFAVEVWKSTDGTSWTEQDTTNNPSADVTVHGAAVAIDSADDLHIIWGEQQGSGHSAVEGTRYVVFDTGTDTFGTEEEILNGDFSAAFPERVQFSITMDLDDIPHVAFHNLETVMGSSFSHVMYSNRIGGSWKTAFSITGASENNYSSFDITISDLGFPQISYLNRISSAIVATIGNDPNASSFTLKAIDLSGLNSDDNYTSIGIDSNGDTWVAYVDSDNTIDIDRHDEADSWTTWDTPVSNGNTGFRPSLAIDGTDIHVFYEENTANDIVHDKYTGTWAGEQTLETGTYNNVKAKWSNLNNNDSAGTKTKNIAGPYHFDASDAGPTDLGNVWTNDANGFDGSTTTFAQYTGSLAANKLEGTGTTAPASGITISDVFARVNTSATTTGANIKGTVKSSGVSLGIALRDNVFETGQKWGPFVRLSVPSGGWTWAKIQALELEWSVDTANNNDVYRGEVIVIEKNSPAEIDYAFMDETASPDAFWNNLDLGGATEVDKTFTVDAFLQAKDNDKTFTTDSILVNVVDKTFTTDSLLQQKDIDKSFTVDSILKKADNDKAFTVDSLIQQQNNDVTFTIDAILTLTGEKEFTANAILKATLDKTFTTDSILKKSGIDKTFSADSVLKKSDNNKTFTIDALVQQQDNDKIFTADAFLRKTQDRPFTVDSILKKSDNDLNFTADAFLRKVQDKNFTIDAFLRAVQDKTFSADAILRKEQEKTFTADSILVNVRTKEFTIDSLLKKSDNDKTFTLDAFIRDIFEKTFTADAILTSGADRTFTADAVLKQSDIDKTFTADSLLQKEQDKAFTLDAFLRDVFDKPFTADAILTAGAIDKTFTVDALLQAKDNDKGFTADSILKKSDNDLTFTIDAFLRKISDKEFTIDAILRKVQEKTLTIDAILRKVQDKTFTIDSLIRKVQTKTFSADSILKKTQEKEFTVDAILGTAAVTDLDRGPIRRPFRRERKEFEFDIIVPILRDNSEEIEIKSSLKKMTSKELIINQSIFKEAENNFDMKAKLDHKKLIKVIKVLEEI